MSIVISAQLVKELRERTGSGMMECKKALVESQGDLEKALEALRISGLAKADKKQDRTAAEGQIISVVSDDKKQGVLIEVNCETDFVARDENFKGFLSNVGEIAKHAAIKSTDGLNNAIYSGSETVDQAAKALTAKIGEKIQIRRLQRVTGAGAVAAYNHGGRIGVLVALNTDNQELAKDIAMHIAASNPIVISANDVPADLIAKEKEIFSAQASESGKPADIVEKMVQGRVQKYLAEVSLEGQPFVKDPNQTVGQLLKSKSATVTAFIRFAVGEGIEKEEVDFAKEVMSTINSQ